MAAIQATRLKKGHAGEDRTGTCSGVLELQHVTPGQPSRLRAGEVPQHPQRLAVGIRSFGRRTRSNRATLEQRDMQYLYKDGDGFCFMDTTSY
jgi:elongation factor P